MSRWCMATSAPAISCLANTSSASPPGSIGKWHLGDRHGDLAWASKTLLGHFAEDGKTFLVGGFLPREEFFAIYSATSGLKVDPRALDYYDIFGTYKIVAICLASGYRAARNGKTHQDVLVAWLTGISYSLLEQLRVKLESVL